GQHEGLAPQDVVHVDALHRQNVDIRNVARGSAEVRFDLGTIDNQRVFKAKLTKLLYQPAGLAVLHRCLLEHDDAAVLRLRRKGMLERECPHFFRQLDGVAAHDRPERTTSTAELRHPRRTVTRTAPPVPFCAYIFLPVRQISLRPLVLCVPRWRLASCQLTQRWMMSVLGSRPKIASDNVAFPASLPSRATILSSITRPPSSSPQPPSYRQLLQSCQRPRRLAL